MESSIRLASGLVVLTLASVTSGAARADSGTVDRASVAEALFDEGRHMMGQGRFAEACPKFAASERLDHAVGTLLNLADCYEHAGLVASAWSTYRAAASAAREAAQPEREQVARQREQDLIAVIPRLRVRVPAPARADGLEVRVDGTLVEPAAWDLGLPVDPGKHTVTASASDRIGWSQTMWVARPGGSAEIPVLRPDPMANRVSPRKVAAVGLVAAGAVSVVVGAVLGARALSLNADSKEHCAGDRCDATGVASRNAARGNGDGATAAIVGGAVAAGVGVTLWVTAPKPGAVSDVRVGACPGPGGASFALAGNF